ncbi:MAG: hypothetical protein HY814_02860 [Candidatus Riflebacteria bacterium]|nr:hypothetical protein [Candidatus Riflebacteria bacterium]
MRNRHSALMRQLQLFDDSYEVYMVLPSEQSFAGDSQVEVLRITGREDATTTVAIN